MQLRTLSSKAHLTFLSEARQSPFLALGVGDNFLSFWLLLLLLLIEKTSRGIAQSTMKVVKCFILDEFACYLGSK